MVGTFLSPVRGEEKNNVQQMDLDQAACFTRSTACSSQAFRDVYQQSSRRRLACCVEQMDESVSRFEAVKADASPGKQAVFAHRTIVFDLDSEGPRQ
jgi:hypothetical protein